MPKRKPNDMTGIFKHSQKDGTWVYRTTVGKHLNNKGQLTSTIFYLGKNDAAARYKRDCIKTEWAKVADEGLATWPAPVVLELAQRGTISEVTATKIAGGIKAQLEVLAITSPEAKDKQLSTLKPDGILPIESVPAFMLTMVCQEFADDETVAWFRKFLKQHSRDKPGEALKLWADLYQLVKANAPKETSTVTVNVGNQIPFDASEQRRKIEAIVGTVNTTIETKEIIINANGAERASTDNDSGSIDSKP